MGIYALAAKKLTAAVNGRLKAKPRNGAQRRTTGTTAHNGAVVPLCRCAPLRGFYRPPVRGCATRLKIRETCPTHLTRFQRL